MDGAIDDGAISIGKSLLLHEIPAALPTVFSPHHPPRTPFKMSSGGSVDHSDEKKGSVVDVVTHVAVADKEVDTAAQLAAGLDELSPEEAIRIRKKIDWHILPLMCSKSGGFTVCPDEA